MDQEERYLFAPLTETHAREVAELRSQHDELRALLSELTVGIDLHQVSTPTLQQFAAALEIHARKEEALACHLTDASIERGVIGRLRAELTRLLGLARITQGRREQGAQRTLLGPKESPTSEIKARLPKLHNALEDIEAAGDAARLQLHLLSVQAHERADEFSAKVESLEERLGRGIEHVMQTATAKTREFTSTVLEFLTQSEWQPVYGLQARHLMSTTVQSCEPMTR